MLLDNQEILALSPQKQRQGQKQPKLKAAAIDNFNFFGRIKESNSNFSLVVQPTLYRITCGLSTLTRRIILQENMSTKRKCNLCLDTGFTNDEVGSIELCPFCPTLAIFDDRYQVIKQLGRGTFSHVFLVRDLYYNNFVRVVKLIRKEYTPLALSEYEWLERLMRIDPDNRIGSQKCFGIVKLDDNFGIVLEYFQPILGRVFESMYSLKRLIVDIALLLETIHHETSLKAIHADIKPENIMFNELDNRFKLIDFGNCVPLKKITDYYENFEIQSLPYRAPEVLVGIEFNQSIDIWSFGVVLLQILINEKQPPFYGDDRFSLISQITELIGPFPNYFEVGKYWTVKIPILGNFDKSKSFWRKWRMANILRITGCKDLQLIDLLSRLLESDPKERLKAIEILKHPFVSSLVPFTPTIGRGIDDQFDFLIDDMMSNHRFV